jgi:hypothetical protein
MGPPYADSDVAGWATGLPGHIGAAPVVRKVVHLPWKQRLDPVAIAERVGLAALDGAPHLGRLPNQPALACDLLFETWW